MTTKLLHTLIYNYLEIEMDDAIDSNGIEELWTEGSNIFMKDPKNKVWRISIEQMPKEKI